MVEGSASGVPGGAAYGCHTWTIARLFAASDAFETGGYGLFPSIGTKAYDVYETVFKLELLFTIATSIYFIYSGAAITVGYRDRIEDGVHRHCNFDASH